MRRLRWALPIIILGISATLFVLYRKTIAEQNAHRPAKPDVLPANVSTKAAVWSISHDDQDGKRQYEVRAEGYRALEQEGVFELTGVELDLFEKKDAKKFNRVRSAKAHFSPRDHVMFSDGEVTVTMGMQQGEEPSGKLLSITGIGVTLKADTGDVSTEKGVRFRFDRGEGTATGATYSPQSRELHLLHDADLTWTASTKPIKIQAGEVTYKEAEQKVFLGPWSKLQRDTLNMEATTSQVLLDKGQIKQVDALQAHGTDAQPKQKLTYGADELQMIFDEAGEIAKIGAAKNTKLISDGANAVTTVTGDRVEMKFVPSDSGNKLDSAVSSGHSVVEAKPKALPNQVMPPTRVLTSEVVQVDMRPGGEEIMTVRTHTPGAMDFYPNAKGQRRRHVEGFRMTVDYAAKNIIQNFRVADASTRTEPEDPKKGSPLLTWSKDLNAKFDEKGELSEMEQNNDFRFEEGVRKGKADKATFKQKEQMIYLDQAARVLDDTGSTEADHIVMNQANNDFTANGKVYSTRLPDKSKKKDGGGSLLDGDQPMQARADKLISTDKNKNQVLRYVGNATLWQGADRIRANEVEIRKAEGILKARGNVVSQFQDKDPANPDQTSKPTPKAPPQSPTPIFTVIRAPELDYDDKEKIALYRGNVQMERPGLVVKSSELRGFFIDDGKGGNKLDRSVADGNVIINQEAKGRKKDGRSEHAEYFIDTEKVIMEGGDPVIVDSVKGTSRGRRLTLLSKEDKILVEGDEKAPAVTKLKKKS